MPAFEDHRFPSCIEVAKGSIDAELIQTTEFSGRDIWLNDCTIRYHSEDALILKIVTKSIYLTQRQAPASEWSTVLCVGRAASACLPTLSKDNWPNTRWSSSSTASARLGHSLRRWRLLGASASRTPASQLPTLPFIIAMGISGSASRAIRLPRHCRG